MELEIGLALSVLGGLLGVLSFVQSRDKSVEKDAAWRGGVDAKLGMQKDLEGIKASLKDHEGRLSAVESSAKSAHHRLDEYA